MTTECPTPGKHRYATREAAAKAADRTQVPYGRHLSSYECRCGWFHNSKLADDRRYRNSA